MTKDNLAMLKKVMVNNGFIIVLSLIVSLIFFREFTAYIVIGIAVAFFNYLMNSVITGYAMKASKGAIWILLGAVARITIAGAFAIILYNGNRYNIIAYITGYSLHYLAMVISATSQSNKFKGEGK